MKFSKTEFEKCFHCGEPICDSTAIRFASAKDDTTIAFHDSCAVEMGSMLKDMGERGLSLFAMSRN